MCGSLCAQTHTHAHCTNTCTHWHTYTCIHRHTCVCTQHTHAHTHRNTHTSAHAHTSSQCMHTHACNLHTHTSSTHAHTPGFLVAGERLTKGLPQVCPAHGLVPGPDSLTARQRKIWNNHRTTNLELRGPVHPLFLGETEPQ